MAEAMRDYRGIAVIRAEPPCGMITLRGKPEAATALARIGDRLGVAMPEPLGVTQKGGNALLWMSPDEMLAICPASKLSGHLTALKKALKGHHALAVDVSDARVRFSVSGPHAREVLAKLVPIDMSHEGFTPGMVRRTRLGQVAAALWLDETPDGVSAIQIVCFRSVGDYVFDALKIAAQPGSEVHLFTHPAA